MMTISLCRQALSLMLPLLLAPSLWGQSNDSEDLNYADLSLDELLAVDVVTGSKQAESIDDSPVVVSTISAQEIEQFGGENLQEVLERATGVQAHYELFWHQFTIRKGDPLQAPSQSLILLNGRPFTRSSHTGSAMYAALATFPLEAIERIEIVRGPGSVLYGTNAMQGVVNIITKTPEENGFVISAQGGSESAKGSEFFGNYTKGDFSVMLSGHYYDDEGWTYDAPDLGVFNFDQNDFQDNKSILADIRYKGFHFTGNISNYKKGVNVNSSHNDGTFWNLGYAWNLSETWQLDTNLTTNKNEYQLTGVVNRNSEDQLLESTLSGKLGSKTNLLFGAVYENIESRGSNEIPDYKENKISVYFQVDHRFNERFKGIIGGQYNEPENISGTFVPRLGAIFKLSDTWSGKLLYGEAFRKPNKSEELIDGLGITDPPVFGPNPNIDFETVKNIDLQLIYAKDNFKFTGTLFRAEQEDLIAIEPNPNPVYLQRYNNVAGLEMTGIELEFKYIPNERILFTASASHQENESETGIKNFTLSSNTEVKLGISYRKNGFSIGVHNAYFSAFEDNVIRIPNRVKVSPDSDDYHFLTAKASYSFKDLGRIKKLSLYAYGRNLLNEDIFHPEVVTNTINTAGELPGTTFQVGAKLIY